MEDFVARLSEGLATAAPDARNFARPIIFLDREHYRQTVTYGILKVLADAPSGPSARDDAKAVLAALTEHLPLHIEDEERDLFELLRERARPEDRIAAVLGQLSAEHEEDERLVESLIEELRRIANGEPPTDPPAFRASAHAFAELQKRHLDWENKVILPLAQERLSADDQTQLGRRMAARRGIEVRGS